ncbi:MAG: SusC/RagA family TonB-linked outer membrane protein [Chitinophagaceae bacterium]
MRKLMLLMGVLLFAGLQMLAQQRTITGKVTDANGNPIPNATVLVKGSSTGTTTKADGTYSLNISPTARVVVISSIGLTEQEFSIGNKGIIDASLQSSDKSLSEVVVVGYGTQRKKDLTGSTVNLKGSIAADKPIQTFDQALAGRAAGVQISVPNGVVNAPPVFRIRGTNSISLSSYPLIIVDGVPSFSGDFSSTAAAGNALGNINPNDIESIDIAKDAAAASIYGSRAANGVVFITTKKGKAGRAKVNYNGWASWSKAYRLPELLSATDYIAFKTSAVANNPTASAITYTQIKDAAGNPIDTKWSDQVYRQGFSHNHNINVSGGSENTSYYFSTGYTDQQGIIRKNDFKRMNTLFNVDTRLGKMLTIGGKISFSNEKNLAANSSGSLSGSAFNTGGLGRLSFVLPPILAPYNNDGSYNINGSAIGSANITGLSTLSYYNPAPLLDLNRSNSEFNHITSNAYIQLKPLSFLTLKSLYGIDYLLIDNEIFWTPLTGDGFSTTGYAWSGAEKYKTSLWTNTAQADFTLGEKHNIGALIGTEQTRRTSSGYGINRTSLSDPAYNVVQAGFTVNNPADLFLGENYLLSSFGRLNYNYDKKYLLSGNVRRDEYSALGVKKGNFWGVSAGWEVAREKFWETAGLARVFSSFKLRGSYGKVGNIGGIGDYSPYSTYASGIYGGAATLAFNAVGNNLLQWETSKKTDVGLSFGLLRDKITADFAYYSNNIDGLILNVAQAPSTGLPTSPQQNVGSMYNKGIELSLNANIVENKNFSWSSSFNITTNTNSVTSLAPGLTNIQTSTAGSETVNRTEVGKSLGYLWVIRTGGVDAATGKRIFINSAGTPVFYQYYAPTGQFNYSTTADGLTKYVSPTGGTSITQAADAVMYKNVIPKVYGGFNNDFRYKNFDLNVLVTYQLGFYVYYGSNAGLHDQRWWQNGKDVLTDAWKAKDDAGKLYAKPVYGDNVSNGSAMPLDINVFKGDFAKLKNLTLGYTLPKSTLDRIKLSTLRFYVSAQNLAIVTKYPGPDPEVSSNGNSTTGQGVDRNTAGNARTILVGLNIGL